MSEPIFKEDKVSQRFNLEEMFGSDFTRLGDREKRLIKESLAEAIIEVIKTRTADGRWRPGSKPSKNAGKYSEAYANSPDFIGAGKSKDQVNMRLSGDMLDLLDIIKDTSNTIEIGWDDGVQSAKAYNHNIGDTVPRRPFFGLAPSEEARIAREFKPLVEDAINIESKKDISALADKLLRTVDKYRGE
jgi:hypothetical protein